MTSSAEVKELIKKLGGTNKIFLFISAKGFPIKIASIYKWKNNGIPYKYRLLINELANKENIKIESNIFDNINNYKLKNEPTQLTVLENGKQASQKSINFINYIMFFAIFILLAGCLYFFYLSKNLEQKVFILDKKISLLSNNQEPLALKNKINSNSENINKLNNFLINNKKLIQDNQNLLDSSLKSIEGKFLSLNSDINSLNSSSTINGNNNSLRAIIYLFWTKENILNGNPWSSNVNFITQYINNNTNSPDDIIKSSKILIAFSNIKIISKFELRNQIEFIIKNRSKIDIKTKTSESFIDKMLNLFKKFIQIEKINNDKTKGTKIILNEISNHFDYSLLKVLEYSKELEKNSNINNNAEYNLWLKNLQNLARLEQSIDLIITWIIEEGIKN